MLCSRGGTDGSFCFVLCWSSTIFYCATNQHLHWCVRELCKKTDREKKAKGLSPHARDNQLQVGSSGGPIRPLVAEILIFYLSSAGRENRCSSFLRSADGNEEDWVARRDRTVLTHKKYAIVSYDMVW